MRGAFGKREIIIMKKHPEYGVLHHISVCREQTGTTISYHHRTVPSHTVPIHTNTIHTYIHTYHLDSFDFRSFFFSSSSLLFLSSPSCLSFSCNLSFCRSLPQTLPSRLSSPLLSLLYSLLLSLILLSVSPVEVVSQVDPLVGS